METKNQPLHIQVANLLIEQLKKGTAPWQKPWSVEGIPSPRLPYNALTGNRYKGINAMNLLLSNREDPRWLTFKQAESMGAKINRREKGTLIQFIKTDQPRALRDEKGKILYDEIGQPLIEKTPLAKPIVSSAWVFNAAQVSGLNELAQAATKHHKWDPVSRADALIQSTGAEIHHHTIDQAFYHPKFDYITLPERSQFTTPSGYYATALHELAHWSGHPSRLDRSSLTNSGLLEYSKEELRAEIASMLLGTELGINHDPGQHAAYVESWVSVLENTPFEIHSAATDAEKIFDFLLAYERVRAIGSSLEAELALPADRSPNFLSTGDEIPYRDHIYRVEGHLKQGRLRIEQLPSGLHFTLSPSDQLYQSLLNQKLGIARENTTRPQPEGLTPLTHKR